VNTDLQSRLITIVIGSGQQRTRRADLGTIDLDPDPGAGRCPPSDQSSQGQGQDQDTAQRNVLQDGFVAPAIKFASANNFGLDLFVQVSFPPVVESTGNINSNVEVPLRGSGSHTSEEISTAKAPSFDIEPFVPLLDYVEGHRQGQPPVTLPSTSLSMEHSNLPGVKTEQSPSVVDRRSRPDEAPVETGAPDQGLVDDVRRNTSLKTDCAIPVDDSEESIRFSLPSEFRQDDFPATQELEIQELWHQPPASDGHCSDVDKDYDKDQCSWVIILNNN